MDLHRNEIAERLREAGLAVSVGVGHSSFEIDLVLAAPGAGQPRQAGNPDRPRVAVLLDGPGWDGRRSTTDRDLLPVDVLGNMGWERIERVWTPEWVADPDAVVARLVEAAGGPFPLQEPSAQTPEASETPEGAPTPEGAVAAAPLGPAGYRQWRPQRELPTEILDRAANNDEGARALVVEVARSICDVESPIARHRLIMKVCGAFGLPRPNAAQEARVRGLLGDSFAYIDEYDFVWRSRDAMQVAAPYRLKALDHVGSIAEIHPRELVALMADVRATSPEWSSPDELYQRALRRLSTRRWKWRLSTRGILPALEAALKEAERQDAGGRI